MDLGKLKYYIAAKNKVKVEAEDVSAAKTLMLTLIDMSDEDILSSQGLSELRKKRIIRLTGEARKQGMLLSYEDLNALLLSSVSTLKRDVNSLKREGYVVPLRRRGNR